MSHIPSLLRIDNQTDSGQHKYSYVYDYVGNRTVMSVTDGGGSMYAYDAENRLIMATKSPSALSAACDTRRIHMRRATWPGP